MTNRKTMTSGLIMGALLVALIGCQKNEGPAQQAGKEIDKATDKAGQQIEKAGDAIQDAAKDNKSKSD